MRVAFLGLGVMGFPMAGHVRRAGHAVTVFNRSEERARAWVARHGGAQAATVAEAVADAEIVLMCVGADRDVRAVGREALAAMRVGATLVDHTTASAEVAREMAALAGASGKRFVDAPVSGGQAGAENGALTVMCGGEQDAFDAALPVMEVYAKAVKRMGPPGAGQLTKMINQVCIAGVVQGLAEAVHFAKCAGLDPGDVLEAISKGAAQSWQMDNRWHTMARTSSNSASPRTGCARISGLCSTRRGATARTCRWSASWTNSIRRCRRWGRGRWDSSSLAARLEDRRRPVAGRRS